MRLAFSNKFLEIKTVRSLIVQFEYIVKNKKWVLPSNDCFKDELASMSCIENRHILPVFVSRVKINGMCICLRQSTKSKFEYSIRNFF